MEVWRRSLLAVLGAGLIAYVVQAATGLGGRGADAFFESWVYLAIELGATGLCLARAVTVRGERGPWLLLGGFLLLWTLGDVYWVIWLAEVAERPYPSPADGAYYLAYGFAYAGIVALLRARLRPVMPSLWLDGLVGGLTLAALCAALAIGPIVGGTDGDAVTVAVTLGYPVCDLLLLCFVGVAFGLTGWRPGTAWTLIGLSLAMTAAADLSYAYVEARGSYEAGALIGPLWPASMVAMALAAWHRGPAPTHRRDGLALVAGPAFFGLLSLGLLAYGQVASIPAVAAALAIAALLVAGVRGTLTFRENLVLLRRSQVEALTDALSGLGNRRRLIRDLEAAVGPGAAQTLVYFDLDGFKAYNDSFGHAAGDALLARLGRRLAAAVEGHGEAYRVGGDEFCALIPAELRRDAPEIVAAAAALSEHGEGFSVGVSFGLVALPAEAGTATRVLQLADERMYADKRSARTSPPRQARDLLVQVLAEREVDVRRRADDVPRLAGAVARQLGLSAEEVDEATRAAELHDIGEVAVPDAVLRKPGPLDDLEWELVRRHTIAGERILAAAPALRPVARLVRSSHERWDGTGYPDGLVAEQIPLGARIVAVCAAYVAMTSERPYRAAVGRQAALAELIRCGGTQFDPAVTAALMVTFARDHEHESSGRRPIRSPRS